MKNNMKWFLGAALVLFIGACASTGNSMEDIVVTQREYVLDEILQQIAGQPITENSPAIIYKVEDIPNKWVSDQVSKFMPDATEIVLTERQFLKEEFQTSVNLSQVIVLTLPSVINPETGETEIDPAGVVSVVGGIASTFFPPLAPFLPLLGLIPWAAKKRSRVHLKEAVGKAVPHDGTIDILGAIKSVSKAFGLDHTTDDPDELEKVAKKLRVKVAAKNGDLETMHATLESMRTEATDPKKGKATLVN